MLISDSTHNSKKGHLRLDKKIVLKFQRSWSWDWLTEKHLLLFLLAIFQISTGHSVRWLRNWMILHVLFWIITLTWTVVQCVSLLQTDINSIRSQPNMRYSETSGRVFARKSDYVNSIIRACARKLLHFTSFYRSRSEKSLLLMTSSLFYSQSSWRGDVWDWKLVLDLC